jgi:hypothetical protein
VSIIAPARPYRNIIMVRGPQFGAFDQRVPVPIGMLKPLTHSGVSLNLLGTGTVHSPANRQRSSSVTNN